MKLSIPVLTLGADGSLGEMVGQAMHGLAEDVTTLVIKDSGHWIPEEQPVVLACILREFLERP